MLLPRGNAYLSLVAREGLEPPPHMSLNKAAIETLALQYCITHFFITPFYVSATFNPLIFYEYSSR